MADWTGERFILGAGSPEVHHEHLHRYRLAALFAPGRNTLDLGCGSGVGSGILSAAGATVSAIDIDPDAVGHAANTYGANVSFAVGSATDLPYPDATFDLITCFEVIEHVAEQDEVVAEAARVLSPDGMLLMSTPMREEYNRGLLRPNPFHVREMEHDEFAALLSTRFTTIRFLRQRSVTASVMWEERTNRPLAIAEPPGRDQIRMMSPVYEVAICTRANQLPEVNPSIYIDLEAQGSAEPSLVSQIRDARIELDDADRHARELAQHLERLDAQVASLQEDRQAHEQSEGK